MRVDKIITALFHMRNSGPKTAAVSFLARFWMHHGNGEFRGTISVKMMSSFANLWARSCMCEKKLGKLHICQFKGIVTCSVRENNVSGLNEK